VWEDRLDEQRCYFAVRYKMLHFIDVIGIRLEPDVETSVLRS
jgi:hypothetical protein